MKRFARYAAVTITMAGMLSITSQAAVRTMVIGGNGRSQGNCQGNDIGSCLSDILGLNNSWNGNSCGSGNWTGNGNSCGSGNWTGNGNGNSCKAGVWFGNSCGNQNWLNLCPGGSQPEICIPGTNQPEIIPPQTDCPEIIVPEIPRDPEPGTPDETKPAPENPGGSGSGSQGGGNQSGSGSGSQGGGNQSGSGSGSQGSGNQSGSGSGSTENRPSQEGDAQAYIQQVADLVNEERAKAGLSPVTLSAQLSGAAAVRSQEITRSFSHTRPDGTSFSTVLRQNGISYQGSGENIAYGQQTPQAVMNAWMNSQGHRANILNSRYTAIGVGYFEDSRGVPYWTQLFTY